MQLINMITNILITSRRTSPVRWQYDRTSVWWEVEVSDRQFMTSFRRNRVSFDELCALVEPHMRPDPTSGRVAVLVAKLVAIAIQL